MMKTILITGGAGFIGTNLVRHLAGQETELIVVDHVCETWNRKNFCDLAEYLQVRMYAFDLCDRTRLAVIFDKHDPEWVMHLAAESHVDKSIAFPDAFVSSNVQGTMALLETAMTHWKRNGQPNDFRFHYCSTDEVYGSLGTVGVFHEVLPLHPNNPYSATKAAGEHLVTAWANSSGLPVIITRSSNNYGPCQGPDKFIPLTIRRCLKGEPVLIHGTGQNIRDWIHVDDHVRAIHAALERSEVGEVYNIGGGPDSERSNLEMAETICDLVDEMLGHEKHASRNTITFVTDRPGNDLRYAMDTSKFYHQTGWKPEISLEIGLRDTVQWYIENGNFY
ncbi:MAG: dTDP-glucose 4,6-dehydratase [Planctomycetaceae bacterium]|nr:dTDP-glucose 4,6-dehydratase [Planctomycetaceae bacterium]